MKIMKYFALAILLLCVVTGMMAQTDSPPAPETVTAPFWTVQTLTPLIAIVILLLWAVYQSVVNHTLRPLLDWLTRLETDAAMRNELETFFLSAPPKIQDGVVAVLQVAMALSNFLTFPTFKRVTELLHQLTDGKLET